MNSNTNNKLSSFVVSTLPLAIALVSSQVHAAESLETVIVTASKIEQDIQKTAISMESISEETLSNSGITNVAEIAKFTPGLQLDKEGGGLTATVRIRGIGTPGTSALDPSVPIFIDGVAQARTGAGFQDLLDIARVEVLRGPQGTLYGRNSTAGAINVWTKDANTHSWEGSLQAQLGNYNNRELKGTVNIPIADDLLALRLSAFKVEQDGYLDNGARSDTSHNRFDRSGARAKFLFTPTDDLNVQWITSYSDGKVYPGYTMVVMPSLFTRYANSAGGIVSQGGTNILPHDDKYNGTIYSAAKDLSDEESLASSITVNWDINDDIALTSITAFDRYDVYQTRDQDISILQWSTSSGPADTDSWSQEFRLAGYLGDDIEFVTGAYYYKEEVSSYQTTENRYADQIAAFQRGLTSTPSRSITDTETDALNRAIFGQLTYNFTQDFSASLGLRRSWVEKNGSTLLTVSRYGMLPDPFLQRYIIDHETVNETDTSGVLKLRYDIAQNAMVYASYDRGFKPGGFNRLISPPPGVTLPTSYSKEVSENYEIGAKTQWFNDRLQANVALFYMEFSDYHFQTIDARSNIIVDNLPSVTTQGVEIDMQAVATSNLTVGFSAAYIDAYVKELKAGSNTVVQGLLHEDQWLGDASRVTANVDAEYSYPLSDGLGEAFARVDYAYRSEYLLGDFRDGYRQGGFGMTNLRAGVRKLDTHWQITGWVKNLFDKEYLATGNSRFANQTDGFFATQGAPRTYGVTVQYDY
ncbi:MAG: TonB-dependent receptor [Spongiibacteraceae bacterium]